MVFSYWQLREELGAPADQPDFAPPRRTPLGMPVADATVGILTSCGVHLPTQPPLGVTNDLSYRLIPRTVETRDLEFSHETPVRIWAEQDLNVAYPRDRLLELETEGVIGRLADEAASIVGSISRFEELVTEMVPRIQAEFVRQDVDLVLLVPF